MLGKMLAASFNVCVFSHMLALTAAPIFPSPAFNSSTCHVILPEPLYDALDEASEDEEDMLDLAFGLTPTSRLGCQVVITEHDFKDQVVELPKATRNFYVDGHVPKPH